MPLSFGTPPSMESPANQYNGGGAALASMQGYQQRLGSKQNYDQQLGLGNADYGHQSALQGQALAGQEQMQGAALATQRAGYASQQQIAQTQAAAAELPAQLRQQRFGQVMPYLTQALSGAQSGLGANGGQANMTGQPTISANPIWNDQQIQQQVNSSRAANDQSTATKMRGVQNSAAGRGYGANSPLSQALGMGLQNQNLATNTANEQSTRWNAAQGNAQQVLSGQQAQETQFANRQNEAIQRSQVYQQYLSAALGSLSNLAS